MNQFWKDITHPEAVAFLNSSVVSQYPILQKYMNSCFSSLTHEDLEFLFSGEYWKDFYFKEKFDANFWGHCSFSVRNWHEDDWKFRSDFTGLFSMFLTFPQSMEGAEDYISFDNVLFMQYEINDIFRWYRGDYSFLNTRKTDKIFVREFGETEVKTVGDIIHAKTYDTRLRKAKRPFKIFRRLVATHGVASLEMINYHKTEWEYEVPSTIGVYFFFKNSEIVYIGQSENMQARIRQHGNRFEHTSVSYIEGEKAYNLESTLIGLYNPVHNVHHRTYD